jgi:uncharacterized protein DUF4845
MKLLKTTLIVLMLVLGAIYSYKLLPPYMEHYQFQDAMDSEAKFDTYSNRSEDDIRESIAKKAKEFEIPITLEQIHVERSSRDVSISMDYTVHIEMPGPLKPVDLTFHVEAKNTHI